MTRACGMGAAAAAMVVCAAAAAAGDARGAGRLDLRHRWVYLSANLLVEANVDRALGVMARAARAGYTGIALSDSKFMRWGTLPGHYEKNVARVRAAAAKLKLDVIPCVMPIGYSGSLLSRDPNLAEGLPVKDAPFAVRKGRLVPIDDSLKLANGSFDLHHVNRPGGWDWTDQPGKISFIDTAVFHHGSASLRMQEISKHSPIHGHGRVMQKLKVKPYRYWHVSAWVKTRKFSAASNVKLLVLAGGRTLNHFRPNIAPTQPWQQVHGTFNSLDNTEVSLYLGVWHGSVGQIWWDDVRIEPGGLVNVVRRKGAPLTVTSDDGKTTYVEGRDFAPARDERMGNSGYKGNFDVWHARPEIAVPPGSSLKDRQTVRISYYHVPIVGRSQVMCCMTEPGLYKVLDWQIAQVHKHFDPAGYFMQHDEIRVHGWDASCQATGRTGGQMLADNVRRCARIIRKRDPGKSIYVWSDMFDPHHNARASGTYYLVKGEGPWHGSWKGLDKNITIVNWNGRPASRLASLKHFESLGCKQILAGYYDAAPERIAGWLGEAAKVKGVVGVMYTTWQRRYEDLETFAEFLDR